MTRGHCGGDVCPMGGSWGSSADVHFFLGTKGSSQVVPAGPGHAGTSAAADRGMPPTLPSSQPHPNRERTQHEAEPAPDLTRGGKQNPLSWANCKALSAGRTAARARLLMPAKLPASFSHGSPSPSLLSSCGAGGGSRGERSSAGCGLPRGAAREEAGSRGEAGGQEEAEHGVSSLLALVKGRGRKGSRRRGG